MSITIVSTITTIDFGTLLINRDNRVFDDITLSEPGVVVGDQVAALAGVNATASGAT